MKKKTKVRSPRLLEDQSGRYQYFPLTQFIEGFTITQDVVESAKRLVETKNVTLDSLETGYLSGDMEQRQVCVVRGSVREGSHTYALNLLMDHNGILTLKCNGPSCRYYYDARYNSYYSLFDNNSSICVHIAALLILIQEYQKSHAVGDATDRMGRIMLDMFRNMHAGEEARKDTAEHVVAQVELSPRLILEDDRLRLSFKIGSGRMYVLKNISKFVTDHQQGNVITLGKNTSIDLSTAQFTPGGQQYLNFLRREVKQEQDHKRTLEEKSSRWYAPEVSAEGMVSYLELYGTRLDDFYDMAKETHVAFVNRDDQRKEISVLLTEGSRSVRLNLDVEREKGHVASIVLSGSLPFLLEGSKYYYFIDGEQGRICRLDAKSTEQIEPLLRLADEGEIDLHIGRNNIPEFYYRILPRLRACAEITDYVGSAVANLLPKEVEFLFYLDADKDTMICKPVASYEKQEFAVLDFLDRNPVVDSFRDKLREQEALGLAMRYFPTPVEDSGVRLLISQEDEDNAYRILDEGVSALMEIGEVHCTDRFKRRNIRRKVKVSVGVSVASEIMDLEITADDLSMQELLDVLASYRMKKKYHKLKNGDFVDITDESIAELSAMMDAMNISPKEFAKGKMHLPLYRAIYLDKMLESCQEIYASRDHYFRNLVKDFKTVGDSDHEVPDSLKKVLRNYQKYGYKWMRVLAENHFGGILADDMGLGKTVQVISVLLATKDEARHPSLIVCPASLIYNWQMEFEKFAPEIKTVIIAGTQAERRALLKDAVSADVLITSYDLLKRDIAEYEDLEFHFQVIDEAQYIKTHTTAAAKSVKVIKAAHKLALTGTPIENRLSELWSIFDYLMPGFLYSYEEFRRELELPIVRQKDEDATKRLKRMVSPFILRRLKQDVLKDLPDKMEELQYAHMESKQQQLYDAQVAHMKQMLQSQDEESFKKNKIQILAELTRIRQICCDPALMVDNYKGESAKRLACMELIESAIEGDHKMLVFSQFTTMLDILARELDNRGIAYYTITGATAKEKRMELVNAFNTDQVPVFLISLKAGGTGLNLTGADVVIHYDPWWNVAAQNQATDRAHRIGQTKVVTVFKLIVKNSIEEKIVKMQQEKADLADAILSGDGSNVVNMSKDDLLNLLL